MLNRVVLMGRLVADPELRQTPNGVFVASFKIAVDRNYQQKDTGERQADFISCVAFDRAAEFAEKYLHQGMKIAVTGRIQTGSYTNGASVPVIDVEVTDAEYPWID